MIKITKDEWKDIFAEDIEIAFDFTKNGKTLPLEFKFKRPDDEAMLEILAEINNLDKVTETLSRKDGSFDPDKIRDMKEEEMIKVFGSDKDMIKAALEIKRGYTKVMGKSFISGSGFNKSTHKNFKTYYESLHSLIRETVYENFMDEIQGDEKKSDPSSKISISFTTMPSEET